jgi:MFS family permease
LADHPAGRLNFKLRHYPADLVLAFAPGLWGILSGVALWGLHMGFTQGVLATLVADSAPPELRGTAFGMFNLVTGAALLAASVIAGVLWDAFGAQWTFLAGAVFAVLTIGGLIPLHGKLARGEREVPTAKSPAP